MFKVFLLGLTLGFFALGIRQAEYIQQHAKYLLKNKSELWLALINLILDLLCMINTGFLVLK